MQNLYAFCFLYSDDPARRQLFPTIYKLPSHPDYQHGIVNLLLRKVGGNEERYSFKMQRISPPRLLTPSFQYRRSNECERVY